MGKDLLTMDSEFVVKEEKVLVYILALLFFALFVYGLIDAIMKHFTNVNYLSFIFMIALVPAFIFLRKGKSNNVYIRINKTGIYQDEKLITGWPYFIDAYIKQKATTLSIQDNFLLVIEYQKAGLEQGFRRKIPLTNTQNKSEEDIIGAIKFFWTDYKKDSGWTG